MNTYSQYYSKPNNYDEIIHNLFIGNKESLYDASKFQVIINCTKHIPFPPDVENIDCERVPINDDSTEYNVLLQYKDYILKKIHTSLIENKKVLVHCHAGMQRSCTIVALYLIKYYGMRPTDAIKFIQRRRPIAFMPEPTFKNLLFSF